MARRKSKRHLSETEIEAIAEWILESQNVPSWSEVSEFALVKFGVDRTVEAIRRRELLNRAMKRRRAKPTHVATKKASSLTSSREIKLEQEIARLQSELSARESQIVALLERNLRLTNAMTTRLIPVPRQERSLPPINRDPTYARKKKSDDILEIKIKTSTLS